MDDFEQPIRKAECPTKKKLFYDGPISAKEAAERAAGATKIRVESELMSVYTQIYEAAGNGLYEVNVYKSLSENALKRLDELGYKYERFTKASTRKHDDEFEEYGYKITWKQ